MKYVLVCVSLGLVQSWFSPTPRRCHNTRLYQSMTTPFEADYYDNDDDDDDVSNPFNEELAPLAVPFDTKLTIGLNKYSHDTSLCAADSATGKVLFALTQERLFPRIKHQAGNVASLVEKCLTSLELDLDAIETVVVNNHHHAVLPLETKNMEHLEWQAGLQINGVEEAGHLDDENLLDHCSQHEVSHHLAHAYSTATQAPFDDGLIVVMDGMGETYRTMKQKPHDNYYSDFDYLSESDDFTIVPADLESRPALFDWREAESVYRFTKSTTDDNKIDIVPVFKRFQQEHTPPWLNNHGFENMDSLGALYSRASSHIFGDWNACGKVMGLAPWKQHEWAVMDGETTTTMMPPTYKDSIVAGSIADDSLQIDRGLLSGMPLIARNDADLFDPETMVRRRRYDFDDNEEEEDEEEEEEPKDENNDTTADYEEPKKKPMTPREKVLPARVALDAIGVAARIQEDLETVAMDFVRQFKGEERNLCLAGGVALNSVLNGRLARELDFEETYISPYPGDDGIAVGCCAFGLYGPPATKKESPPPPVWKQPLSPYLGPYPTEFEMKLALQAAAPWLEVETVRNEELRLERIVSELDEGQVVALYQGRSEMGPRALGHRSILADPRKKKMVRFINESVKKRESFRPFAPSALAEEAADWFDLGSNASEDNSNVSPYMSMTAMVKESKRALIPAVTHVDGSSRLQTVTPEAEPFYHKLISQFFARTGIPMVLNTSFNTIPREPIVESPKDAIRSFLCSMGSIQVMVMGDYIITRKRADIRALVGERSTGSTPSCPKRAGRVEFQSDFSLRQGVTAEEEVDTVTRVRMPERLLHHDEQNNWFTLADELEGEILSICDGTNTVNDMMAYFTVKPNDEGYSDEEMEDTKEIFEQVSRRLTRLYEHGFISW